MSFYHGRPIRYSGCISAAAPRQDGQGIQGAGQGRCAGTAHSRAVAAAHGAVRGEPAAGLRHHRAGGAAHAAGAADGHAHPPRLHERRGGNPS